jgi:hypothetical protein
LKNGKTEYNKRRERKKSKECTAARGMGLNGKITVEERSTVPRFASPLN